MVCSARIAGHGNLLSTRPSNAGALPDRFLRPAALHAGCRPPGHRDPGARLGAPDRDHRPAPWLRPRGAEGSGAGTPHTLARPRPASAERRALRLIPGTAVHPIARAAGAGLLHDCPPVDLYR